MRKVLFVVLVVALQVVASRSTRSGKWVVVPPSAWLSRRGWTRAACELVLARLEKKQKDADDLMHSLRLQAARAGIKSDMPGPEIVRYSCEPD